MKYQPNKWRDLESNAEGKIYICPYPWIPVLAIENDRAKTREFPGL